VRVVRTDRLIKVQIRAEPFGELGCEGCLPRATVQRRVTQRRNDTFTMHASFASRLALSAREPLVLRNDHVFAANAARRICLRWWSHSTCSRPSSSCSEAKTEYTSSYVARCCCDGS